MNVKNTISRGWKKLRSSRAIEKAARPVVDSLESRQLFDALIYSSDFEASRDEEAMIYIDGAITEDVPGLGNVLVGGNSVVALDTEWIVRGHHELFFYAFYDPEVNPANSFGAYVSSYSQWVDSRGVEFTDLGPAGDYTRYAVHLNIYVQRIQSAIEIGMGGMAYVDDVALYWIDDSDAPPIDTGTTYLPDNNGQPSLPCGPTSGPAQSGNPVRYSDGTNLLFFDDMPGVFGGQGIGRSWTTDQKMIPIDGEEGFDQSGGKGYRFGFGGTIRKLSEKYITLPFSNMQAVSTGLDTYNSGRVWMVPMQRIAYIVDAHHSYIYYRKLSADPLVYTWNGITYSASGYTFSLRLQEAGKFDSWTSPSSLNIVPGGGYLFSDGYNTSRTFAADGSLVKQWNVDTDISIEATETTLTRRQLPAALTVGDERLTFSYFDAGASDGKISEIAYELLTSGGWTTLRSVHYGYYDGIEAHGNTGNLKSVVLKDENGTQIQKSYYRYYSGEPGGYSGAIKLVLGGAAYERMLAASGDPETASDSNVSTYADFYFEYDSSRRVVLERVQGEGCSTCSGGQGSYTFQYVTDRGASHKDVNDWRYKTIETLPDGSQNVVYCNAFGQSLLNIRRDVAASKDYMVYRKYDLVGHLILEA